MKHASEKEKKKHENHPDVQDIINSHNNFGFKSGDMAPEIPELVAFEQTVFEMINKITFTHHHNEFLESLKKELTDL